MIGLSSMASRTDCGIRFGDGSAAKDISDRVRAGAIRWSNATRGYSKDPRVVFIFPSSSLVCCRVKQLGPQERVGESLHVSSLFIVRGTAMTAFDVFVIDDIVSL